MHDDGMLGAIVADERPMCNRSGEKIGTIQGIPVEHRPGTARTADLLGTQGPVWPASSGPLGRGRGARLGADQDIHTLPRQKFHETDQG